MRWPAVLSKAVPMLAIAGAIGLVLAGAGVAAGPSSLTAIDSAYTQNFDTLASVGESNVLPDGWALAEAGSSANNDGNYTAGTGSSNAGDTYSFGAAGSSERAFGTLLSGTLTPTIGAAFSNDTGQTISALDVAYTGEQWRLGQSGRGADRLDFQYNPTASGLTTTTGWVDVDALDFSSPVTTGTVGALDGNAPANRAAVAGTISGLSIAPGQTFWIRWADFNVSGSDDGLSVDDFSLTPHTAHTISVADATVTEGDSGTTTAGFAVSLTSPAPAGGVTFDIATSDGSAHAPDDYTAAAVTGATIPEGESTYSFDVSVNGDTQVEPDEDFSVDITNVTGFDPGDTHAVGTILNDDPLAIHEIQGATHISPFRGQRPLALGIVTARSTNGFWMQDPSPDSDPATSEGIFVFTSSAPPVAVGDSVRVQGTVQEFRPGGSASANLTTTELAGTPSVTVLSSGNALPAPTVIGTGGRIPPDTVVEDDASGDVETSGVFDPDQDGLDFYESLEGMRVQLNDAVAVGPTATDFGETPVVGDDGANASVRTARGGVLLRPDDGNPERVTLDDLLTPLPDVNVGDHYSAPIVGVMDYNFGNPFIEVTTPGLSAIHDGVTRETTAPVAPGELAVATFNFENLAATNPQSKFDSLASLIVNNLRSPDLIAGEEVQDNDGATDDGVVDATQTLIRLVNAIQAAGGPAYQWREIDPVDGEDGGEPGGNIRQVFLFRADRGLSFVDRPGGDSTTPNEVTGSGSSTQLLYSPGRIDPGDGAWDASRKPLAAELSYRGHKLFAIVNHFNSKGGDDPLRGRFQPPVNSSETQRHQQAHLVADFVSSIGAADPSANVVVLGDLNDFEFSDTVGILEDAGLHDLMGTLPLNQRYSYDFEGNSQVLDHILFSGPLFARPLVFDPVHVNSEFFDQASDHDPSVVRVLVNDPPTATFEAPSSTFAGFPFQLSLTSPSGPEPGETFTYAFDCGSGYGAFGASATASCPTTDVGDRSVAGKIRDELGAVTEYRGTVHVVVTFDSLCALVRSYARHADDADALCAMLDDAEAATNPKTRANILRAFRSAVDARTGPQPAKSFTEEQGALLKLLSTRL